MNLHYTYLLIIGGSLFFPLVFSFDNKVAFYRHWKSLWPGMVITAACFIVWDILFTARGVWWFSRQHTLPFNIAGLPLEEWLFFLIVPYACVFIYACLNVYFPPRSVDQGRNWARGLGLALILIGTLNYSRAYTLSTCVLCGLALFLTAQLHRYNQTFRSDRFLLAYSICLIPFLIVNGLLTALPVVLYDDSENVGIRLYTIPIEDVFYGMLLILSNIWFLERFSTQRRLGKRIGKESLSTSVPSVP